MKFHFLTHTSGLILELSQHELTAFLTMPEAAEELSVMHGVTCIVLTGAIESESNSPRPQCPVICVSDRSVESSIVDVLVSNETELREATDAIASSPIAAQTLVQLLRHNENVSVEDGLFAESLAYSTLQHGHQFVTWLRTRKRRVPPVEPDSPAVLIERSGSKLSLTLNRAQKRNAWSTSMRDGLTEALNLIGADETIDSVSLAGNGPCFGAGGDLDEFGSARDAALAHITRATRNPGLLVHRYRQKITAHLHGACVGAGIEIPAFAHRVVAKHDTFFQLPEVSMGLIPGAGGSVSILRRIGRQNLGFMALTGTRIDTNTAFNWGLVDAIV